MLSTRMLRRSPKVLLVKLCRKATVSTVNPASMMTGVLQLLKML